MMTVGAGRFIDLSRWKRLEHFELFRHAQQPFFGVTVDVDVTELWRTCQADAGYSFFLATSLALLRALHGVEPFRLRLRRDQVWLHDRVGIGTTILRDDHTFAFARLDLAPTWSVFDAEAGAQVREARVPGPLEPSRDRDDVVYHSTLPWLSFTAFKNALPGADSIPRVTFGKVSAAADKFTMPVAIEVHHALIDGLDVATFVDRLQSEIDPKKIFG